MKRLIQIANLCSAAVAAQEPSTITHRIVELKYAEAGAVSTLLNTYPVQTRFARPDGHILSLSGSPSGIAAAEDALKKIDVPAPAPQNIELMIYMITAGEQATTKPPAELDAVLKQLRASFGYPSYQVLETFSMRLRDGEGAESNGLAPGPIQAQTSTGPRAFYQCKVSQAHIQSTAKGNVIRLNRVNLGLKVPVATGSNSFNYNDVGINTGIDVREGQKVVVGKANITGTEKSAFIFVVSARVVD
jgi:hypothetical protein